MFVAYRGGEKLRDEQELKAHLASILRLENVGLLLGAGASVGAGGHTVAQLWKNFLENRYADAQWLLAQGFVTEEEIVVDGDSQSEIPNVETLLDTLAISIAEWKRIGDDKHGDAVSVRSNLFREIVEAAKLDVDYWGNRGGALESRGLSDHRTVLQKFVSARQPGQPAPWVFTTNYDLAVEWAAESVDMSVINGFVGLHSRQFSPQSFDLAYRNRQALGEARFGVYNIYLAKLHGSLTWKELPDRTLIELAAPHAWPSIEHFLNADEEELGFMVLPSAAKYMQTTGFVLGEMFRRFAEFLAQSQTSLVISGYGFGDEHINRLILSALLNPTLQLVIYLPEFARVDQHGLPRSFRKLLELKNPRITVVGGQPEAYFTSLANHLPEPTLYDENLIGLRRAIKEMEDDGGHV
ncbi:SIR2 family anti-phage-associated protein [Thalassospira sp. MCCC 1A03138]|uniref:SIR2 family anti-phage-associated protein n=1 Tax=Thalassospira sp. MCCC 1A03138 TaxID=1470576 RepID=UPI000A1EC786|nr:SIR2 family anti-phage-associated protein [Thalassospira sp. MCCC 1A03138]OSQ32238.1 hypothetical protein TH468_00935 [Thalassospira sp. MCCC 1A03138]